MQENNPQSRRASYAGRFAEPAGGAPARAKSTGRAREAQPQSPRRPSGFAAPEPPKRRPATSSKPASGRKAPASDEAKWEMKLERKYRRAKRRASRRAQREGLGWKKWLLIALIALALIVLLLTLIFGGNKTYHQLPEIKRNGEYAPEETPLPDAATAAGAPIVAPPAQEDGGTSDALPALDGNAASDGLSALDGNATSDGLPALDGNATSDGLPAPDGSDLPDNDAPSRFEDEFSGEFDGESFFDGEEDLSALDALLGADA